MNRNLLKGKIVACGYTQAEIAQKLGITPKTFIDKMRREVFTNQEMKALKTILNLSPEDIFLIFM